MLDLSSIQDARERISPHIRLTPFMKAAPIRNQICTTDNLFLKLENLQITGSFKVRGAVNSFLSLNPEIASRGIVTASGGNHGLGVAYVGWLFHVPTTVYLPHIIPQSRALKLQSWGAHVIYEGQVWDEANQAALTLARENGLNYFHPFADPKIIAGQGTLGLEIYEALPEIDTVLVAIGGGGLISGISLALHALNPEIRIIGVEPTGAPTLYESLRARHLVELPTISTAATSLAPRLSSDLNLEIIQQHVSEIVLVSDEEMHQAALWLWNEMGLAVELGAAATIAALQADKVQVDPNSKVCALICGSGDTAFI